MSPKIKKALSVIGAVFTVVLCSVALILLRRGETDRRRSSDDDERNQRIKEGLDGATGKINECRDTAERCEERLRRAEEILRNAIKRAEEENH